MKQSSATCSTDFTGIRRCACNCFGKMTNEVHDCFGTLFSKYITHSLVLKLTAFDELGNSELNSSINIHRNEHI